MKIFTPFSLKHLSLATKKPVGISVNYEGREEPGDQLFTNPFRSPAVSNVCHFSFPSLGCCQPTILQLQRAAMSKIPFKNQVIAIFLEILI